MSIKIMTLVFDFPMPELKTDKGESVPDSTAKFVLLAQADHASDDGENAYVGVDRLCKKTGYSTKTVCNALNALRFNGYTTLIGKSKRDTNNYTIHVDRLQPVKSDDFSHYDSTALAAKTNPSVKPSIKPKTFNCATAPDAKTAKEILMLDLLFINVTHGFSLSEQIVKYNDALGRKPTNRFASPQQMDAFKEVIEKLNSRFEAVMIDAISKRGASREKILAYCQMYLKNESNPAQYPTRPNAMIANSAQNSDPAQLARDMELLQQKREKQHAAATN